jgi:DNA-directed RNA polymerase specialized sigma24 family protein
MHDHPSATDLITRATNCHKQACQTLAERYAPLVWPICRRHRLGNAWAEDVSPSVWLHVADQPDRIREPAALPGWLATTTGGNASASRARRGHRRRPGT